MLELSPTPTQPQPEPTYRLVVIELDDATPRFRANKPTLLVARTLRSPDALLRDVQAGKGRFKWAKGRAICVRHDLMYDKLYTSDKKARNALEALIEKLRYGGHRVNKPSQQPHCVYVIALDVDHPKNPRCIEYYVGETSKTPEQRFEDHRTKARGKKGEKLWSLLPAECGLHLVPELAPTDVFVSKPEAELAEADCRRRLEQMGHRVSGAHLYEKELRKKEGAPKRPL